MKILFVADKKQVPVLGITGTGGAVMLSRSYHQYAV